VANGSGGNGKGYLNELMMFMMGDYAINADCSIVLGNGKPKDGPNAELASVAKKRLVIMTEPNEKQKINIAVVKKMTGGDTITARACHSNKTEHDIFMTLIMECNKKPQLDGRMDKAILRRILDIPFRATFTDNPSQFEGQEYIYEGDPNAKSRENKHEYYCALFNILIEYWKDYQKANMKLFVPPSIEQRNIEYMKSSDDILQFMETNFEKTDNPKDFVKFKEVFHQYKYIVYKKATMKEVREKVEENDFLNYYKEKKIDGKKLKSIITGYKMKEDDDDGFGFIEPNPKYANL
jgi:putative DNA primase/helicase